MMAFNNAGSHILGLFGRVHNYSLVESERQTEVEVEV